MLRKLNRQKLKGLRPLSRRRRNPDTPFGVMPAKWKEALGRGKQEARAMLLGVRAELVSSGIPTEALPEPFELNKRSEEIGTMIASSEYAGLAAQSKLDTPAKKVAEQVFSVFEKVEAEEFAKPVLVKATRVFASRLDTLRAPALANRKARVQVRQASEDAVEEELRRKLAERDALRERAGIVSEQEVEDDDDDDDDIDSLYAQAKDALKGLQRSSPARAPLVAFVKAYESGDPDALMKTVAAIREMEDAARSAEPEEVAEVVEERVERSPRGQRTPAEPRQGRRPRRAAAQEVVEEEEEIEEIPSVAISRGGERLAGYAQYRARERKRAPLSESLRTETAKDILLYVLNDRTTQVWIKGSLTETFVASRGRASWKVASAYAKNWLETPGRTGEPKKSRLGMRVVVATEAEPDKYEVVVAAKTGVGTPAEKPVSLATVVEQLRAEPKSRSNPRSRQGFLRNPFGRQVVADVREVFRRSNPGGLVTALVGAAGFVAGTYAEAEFGLSKQFTRSGTLRQVANPDVSMLLWESEREHLTDLLESHESLVDMASRSVAKWKKYGAPKTAEERRNYDRHTRELSEETEKVRKIKERLLAHLSRKPRTNPRDAGNTDWAVLSILEAEGPLGVDRIVYHSGLLSKLDVLTSLKRLVAGGKVVRRGLLFAAVAEQGAPRQNPRAPYWFVADGSGYRLLKNGEPTGTRYASLAEAKADASAKNAAWRSGKK